jgi:hypothetical protein
MPYRDPEDKRQREQARYQAKVSPTTKPVIRGPRPRDPADESCAIEDVSNWWLGGANPDMAPNPVSIRVVAALPQARQRSHLGEDYAKQIAAACAASGLDPLVL